ncbi:MAG: hypothetical protein KDA69_02255 [Planctomycetaceae bacterium]|nr:hypothetical protein [Planctomycetaceae bacterium]
MVKEIGALFDANGISIDSVPGVNVPFALTDGETVAGGVMLGVTFTAVIFVFGFASTTGVNSTFVFAVGPVAFNRVTPSRTFGAGVVIFTL